VDGVRVLKHFGSLIFFYLDAFRDLLLIETLDYFLDFCIFKFFIKLVSLSEFKLLGRLRTEII